MPDENGAERSCMDLYFINKEGGNFKSTIFYKPYFYLDIIDIRRSNEISILLLKKFENCTVDLIEFENLDLPNHLSGKKHKFLKISFFTVSALIEAKNELKPIITENKNKTKNEEYENDEDIDITDNSANANIGLQKATLDPFSFIIDMREFDVVSTYVHSSCLFIFFIFFLFFLFSFFSFFSAIFLTFILIYMYDTWCLPFIPLH